MLYCCLSLIVLSVTTKNIFAKLTTVLVAHQGWKTKKYTLCLQMTSTGPKSIGYSEQDGMKFRYSQGLALDMSLTCLL